MKRIACALVLGLVTAGCATTDRSGIRDPDQFRQVAERRIIESVRSHTDVARCFEERAALLPMSTFIADEPSQQTTYRLRGFGFSFEEILFEATPTGSRATILMAPNLNAKWRDDFARDRGAVLSACAAPES
jgi:hypothetical protein